MSDNQPHVPSQQVEYLAVSEALLGHPATGEPVVIVTLRPDPPNFAVVNLAIPVEQAWRLAADIQSLLLPFVLLMAVLTAAGCGARVDVESSKWGLPSGERARTQVELNVLRPPEHEEKKPATEAKEKSAVGSGNTTVILNYREGDVVHNHTSIHIDQAAPQRTEERTTVQREVQVEPRRQVDERCQRMAREHEERVRRWKAFPFGE